MKKTEFSSGYPLDILIVDDDIINLTVVKSYLRKLGYQPSLSDGGIKAVELASREQFHLILMDIHMPDMNGLEASSKIREIRGQEVDIVALTSLERDQVEKLGDTSCLTDHMGKPLQFENLKNLLIKTSQRKGCRSNAPRE